MQLDLIAVKGRTVELPGLTLPVGTKPLRLLWVEPGAFLMGSPPDERGHQEEERLFEVTFSRGFWLGETPVTQAQYEAMLENGDRWPSFFSFLPDSPDRPVEMVSWFDADAACQALNKRYVGRIPEGYRFALPSEAQWEYACRAGTRTRYHSGDTEQDLDRVDWHAGNSGGTSHPVQQKPPNLWGFHDVHGNVTEWCHDWYDDYPGGRVVDWEGPESGVVRAGRGRSWKAQALTGEFRSASRCDCIPREKSPFTGFRLSLRWCR